MATAFAVVCYDDGSLTFYKRDTVPSVGDIFEGKTVGEVYTGVETDEYYYDDMMWECSVPWWHNTEITKVSFADVITPVSTAYWFMEGLKYESIDLTNLDTSNVTNMTYMFHWCNLLTDLDLSNFDTSNVTNMAFMFYHCEALTSLDLSSFNTSKVTDMSYMFQDCCSLSAIYVSDKWSVESVTSSFRMFASCNALSGDIAYDSSKDDVTHATYEGGYLTYKQYVADDPIVVEQMLIQNVTLYDLAKRIRTLTGSKDSMTPSEMVTAVDTFNTDISATLSTQDNLITQIMTALASKGYTT